MKVLIVVDMQNDFIDGPLGNKMAKAIVHNVKKKIENESANGSEIIFTRDRHDDEYLNTEEGRNLPVKHCIDYTSGFDIYEGVVESAEFGSWHIVDKDTFGSRELMQMLRHWDSSYASRIDEVELVGLCTEICVISNAVIAKTALPNAHIVVDASCCAGVTKESHYTALDAMKALQIEIINDVREKDKYKDVLNKIEECLIKLEDDGK